MNSNCVEPTESPPKMQKKAYKELNLDEKVSLIRMAEKNPRLSQAQLAKHYEIAKSNVCRILKRRYEYLSAYESWNFSGERKRKLRDSDTKELNLLVRAWCEERKQSGQQLSGTLIQEKAREIANALKISHFVASNGWLQSFQKNFSSETSTIPSNVSGNETLRAHMYKQHQISRMFMCRCCNWAFPDKTSLHIHMQAMASGNPGNVSIIAKSSASPNPPPSVLRPAPIVGNGENGKPLVPKDEILIPPFPGFPPGGMIPSGIFPAIPSREDLLQRLRERALMNGAAQMGMNNLAAWLTSSFPQVDASGVGNLGGTLHLINEEESNPDDGYNPHDNTKGSSPEPTEEDGKMAEMVVGDGEDEGDELDSQMYIDTEETNVEAEGKSSEKRSSSSTGDLDISSESSGENGEIISDQKPSSRSDTPKSAGPNLPVLRSAIRDHPINYVIPVVKLMDRRLRA